MSNTDPSLKIKNDEQHGSSSQNKKTMRNKDPLPKQKAMRNTEPLPITNDEQHETPSQNKKR
jgi:hypothetical protein